MAGVEQNLEEDAVMSVGFDSEVLNAFARTVSHILATRASVSGGAIRSYEELFQLACRKVDEVAPVNVSEKARDKAHELGLGDLRTYCWFCPIMNKLRDGPKVKRLFLWEHYTPVANIQAALRDLGRAPDLEQISAILGRTKIAWVLREEGDKLGNRSRPDPAKTYRDAGVTLVYRWEDCHPVDCRRHRPR
ncbi:hypothetical protein [Sorangium sp. So ce854]|uniref:hypothetical protein n=1 Tax=Sorangium sp. So ce854 TaxID=3133322 RepID=UPI003F60A37E